VVETDATLSEVEGYATLSEVEGYATLSEVEGGPAKFLAKSRNERSRETSEVEKRAIPKLT